MRLFELLVYGRCCFLLMKGKQYFAGLVPPATQMLRINKNTNATTMGHLQYTTHVSQHQTSRCRWVLRTLARDPIPTGEYIIRTSFSLIKPRELCTSLI